MPPTPTSEDLGPLLVILDRNGRICHFNRSAELLSGLGQADTIGKFPWDTFLPADEAARVRNEAFLPLHEKHGANTGHYFNHWLTRSGDRPLIEWSNSVLRDAAGVAEFIVCVGVDVTVREHARALQLEAEDARAATARLMQLVVENLPLMIFMKRADNLRFTLFNRAGEDLLGYDRSELLGKNDYDLFPREQADAFTKADRRVLSESYFADIPEEPIDTRHNGRRLLHTRKVALRDDNGRAEFLLGISEDVTDRIEQATKLNTANQILSGVLNHAPVMIALLDCDMNFILVNDSYARADGKTPDYFVGKNHFALFPNAENESIFRRVAATGEPYSVSAKPFEYEHNPERGVTHWDWTLAPLRDRNGTVSSLLLSLNNVTDRVRALEDAHRSRRELAALNESLEARVADRTRELSSAKDAAERASRAKSEFLSRVSHELRTPLNAILGFAQLLEMNGHNDPNPKLAGEIRAAGTHLLELIDEMLDLSRIEIGRLAVEVAPISLDGAVSDVLMLLTPTLQAQHLTVRRACGTDQIVLADSRRLKQVLLNLLTNAARHSPPGGVIEIVCAGSSASHWRISVIDSGSGIPADQHDRLFQPFQRLKSDFGDGAGIGLALVKQLTELMGGRVGVTSEVGRGSTFWIDLPRAVSHPASRDTAQAIVMPVTSPCTVLYVEDNQANIRVMRALFEHVPAMRLLTARDGDEGLSHIRTHRPDIVLLDIHMPGRDGHSVLAEMRADPELASIPVIALTADAMPAEVERGKRAGFNRYLTKPVDLRLLLSTIEQVRQDGSRA